MFLRSFIISAVAVTLSACNLSGAGQKGPFQINAKVTLSKLSPQANPITEETLESRIRSKRGGYSFSGIRWDGWSQLQISGKYFDEFTGSVSADTLTLDAITKKDRRFDRANVHLFSHLAAARIKQRVANGQNLLKAWQATQVEMKKLFGLNKVSKNIDRGVEQLSLLKGSGRYHKDNANLLLFTGSFLATAGDRDSLNKLTTDFADDAKFNGVGSSIFNAIAIAGAKDGLLQKLSSNLRNYGIGNPPNSADMPNLPKWVNQDIADTVAPVISVVGSNPVTIVIGTPYVDQGATAIDNLDGEVVARAVDSSDVINTSSVGTHTVTYTAVDVAGNVGSATRIVNVVEAPDTEAPVITLTDGSSQTLEVQTDHLMVYQDPGYTVTDNRDVSVDVSVNGVVNTGIVGVYELTYSATDVAGNTASVIRTVNIVDTTKPIVTLLGSSSVEIVEGDIYEDAGAIATDNYDTNVSVNITENTIDNNTVGIYHITYTAVDSSNNQASVTRTVVVTEVQDKILPVISLIGNSLVTVEAGTNYSDLGATAEDNKDGNITTKLTIDNPVNTSIPATYIVKYNVKDAANNAAVEVTRTVIVKDTIAPVIVLTGESAISLVEGSSYTDAGATASDSLDGDITANILVGGDTVDTNTPGVYTVTYNVMDHALNPAAQVTRTVTITEAPDIIAPVIALLGSANVMVEAGTSYTDAGATASDNKDGNLTSAIVVGGSVNVNVPATYVLTYNVQDAVFNVADEVTRTVIVKDTIAPVIVLTGEPAISLVEGSRYTDAGATASDSLDGDITANILVGGDTVDTNTPGVYTITYNVMDHALNPAAQVTRTVTITEAPNVLPMANAGGDKTVEVNKSVHIIGSGIDTDGTITSYNWTENGASLATTAEFDYTPSTIGLHTLTLTVTDNRDGVATDTVIVEAVASNTSPTANAGADVSVEVNASVTLSGLASTDADGNIVNYSWYENGVLLHSSDFFEFTYTPTSEGTHAITLTVMDDSGLTASDTIIVTATVAEVLSATCPASPTTEAAFTDTFINTETLDRPWPDNLNNVPLTVDDIANVFNEARAFSDSAGPQGKKLVMPTQAVWDAYTDSQKALFLINSERCARGILPYEGISPLVETSPAQYYADYLSSNNVFGHNEDGRTPWERLNQLAGVVTNGASENADFFSRAENLAVNSLGSTGAYPTVHEPVAKAIYAWMYDDKEATKVNAAEYTYGHRKFILAKGLVENSGEPNKEGLIGIGVSTVQEATNGFNWTKVYTVMNAFDPNENWPLGNIQTVDLLESNQCLPHYLPVFGSSPLACKLDLQ